MNNDIRPVKLVVTVSVAALGIILHPFAQTGLFQYPLQNQFTPVALNLLVALERPGQVGCLFGNLTVQVLQRFDFTAQRLTVPGFRGVHVLNPLPEILQLIPEGIEQGIQAGAGLLAEALVFLVENLVGKIFELLLQRITVTLQELQFFSGGPAFLINGHFLLTECHPGLAQLPGKLLHPCLKALTLSLDLSEPLFPAPKI